MCVGLRVFVRVRFPLSLLLESLPRSVMRVGKMYH